MLPAASGAVQRAEHQGAQWNQNTYMGMWEQILAMEREGNTEQSLLLYLPNPSSKARSTGRTARAVRSSSNRMEWEKKLVNSKERNGVWPRGSYHHFVKVKADGKCRRCTFVPCKRYIRAQPLT